MGFMTSGNPKQPVGIPKIIECEPLVDDNPQYGQSILNPLARLQ